MERTLIILKPDAVQRGLIGEIVRRFEQKGLKVIGIKMESLQQAKLREHYKHHADKPFFPELVNFMSSTPVILMALEGTEAVSVVRKLLGATNGRNAEPGTIRGDFSLSNQNNLVHASESREIADEEVQRFFKETELHSFQFDNHKWIYSAAERK